MRTRRTVRASETVTPGYENGQLDVDASAGAVTITLVHGPASSLLVRKTDSSINPVILVSSSGSGTVNGASSYRLTARNQSVTVEAAVGSADWIVVAASTAQVPRYVALLTQVAPATITAGPLVTGMRYTITTLEDGDDFTNVGAVENEEGEVFIATGTTPTDYSNGSELDSDGAPIATVLENGLGGTVVWTRNSAGLFTATLAGAFPASRTLVLCGAGVQSGDAVSSVRGVRATDNTVTLSTYAVDAVAGTAAAADGRLTGTPIEIRVYPA